MYTCLLAHCILPMILWIKLELFKYFVNGKGTSVPLQKLGMCGRVHATLEMMNMSSTDKEASWGKRSGKWIAAFNTVSNHPCS